VSEFADALRLQRVLLKSFENWACPRFGVGEILLQCTVVHSSRPRIFFKETASVQVFAQAHFFSKALCGTLIFQQVPHQIVDLKFIGVV